MSCRYRMDGTGYRTSTQVVGVPVAREEVEAMSHLMIAMIASVARKPAAC
jgi:hypothetical protein